MSRSTDLLGRHREKLKNLFMSVSSLVDSLTIPEGIKSKLGEFLLLFANSVYGLDEVAEAIEKEIMNFPVEDLIDSKAIEYINNGLGKQLDIESDELCHEFGYFFDGNEEDCDDCGLHNPSYAKVCKQLTSIRHKEKKLGPRHRHKEEKEVKTKDKKDYPCRYSGCDKKSNTASNRCAHESTKHGKAYSKTKKGMKEAEEEKINQGKGKKYPCRHSGCTYTYATTSGRCGHEKRKHGKVYATTTMKKKTAGKIPCRYPACQVKFVERHNMPYHEKTVHGGLYTQTKKKGAK